MTDDGNGFAAAFSRATAIRGATQKSTAETANRTRQAGRMDPVDWQARNGAEIQEGETMAAGVSRRVRRSPIEVLLSRKAINAEQAKAAATLYEAYALGVVGVRDIDDGEVAPGIRGAGGLQGYAAERLDALARYREAVGYIGRPLAAVVVPVVCREETIAEVAMRRGEMPAAVGGILKVGLEMLAIRYGLVKPADATVDDLGFAGIERVRFRGAGRGRVVLITDDGEEFAPAR
ncbi:MAG TPA: DUF6456 domain-containing protein [Patescibacteria group bacterium]|nr:DUF6456 domain-containing protein [Patescibacteria group bacterium]